MTHDLNALLKEIRAELADAGIEDPAADAELIVGHVLREPRGRVQALAVMGSEITEQQADTIRGLSGERAYRVPLQHLTGKAPFRGIELAVGPGVFIPRPETESVAQFVIDALQQVQDAEPIAVDLCTGSGAIALSLAQEVPHTRVWAVEKSVEAHAWASRNVGDLGDGRVELLLGDIADLDRPDWESTQLGRAFTPLRGRVNVLVSNPPYVPADMVPRDPEVRDHDPELALYGGADGLDIVRIISRVAQRLLLPGGLLVLEHAETQGAAIQRLLTAAGWHAAATHPDLTGRDRTTTAILDEV
ncbi:peptide chain release factor N(5)-glutamine methyltransferase [Leucobacter coleopterorum]|uniref:Release factor glutamine methyltransferase n=1 Tax=Leucobacter coleopterorum TaxID=2714933 RepID=A0ABX6JXH8_9MICO|nr:peptide chain release factor N(5)-glutamine methyltransferase [Leucobacter coleopterorum]QIM19016.1 peptide chain release factor N(5)-glutamine methyltransferase [Leucobacter coleopterorum]